MLNLVPKPVASPQKSLPVHKIPKAKRKGLPSAGKKKRKKHELVKIDKAVVRRAVAMTTADMYGVRYLPKRGVQSVSGSVPKYQQDVADYSVSEKHLPRPHADSDFM